jgi:histone acetyltransferase
MAGAVFSSSHNSKSSSTNESLNKDGPTSTSALLSSSTSNMTSGMNNLNKLDLLSRERKLEKISNYSPCQSEDCKCNGYKVISDSINCKTCSHNQKDHIKQFNSYTDQQINRLLRIVIDVETLFSLICKEEDAETKHIYFFLFKLLRKSILTADQTSLSLNQNPSSVEAHLGKPPFEETSITKAIINFLFCKYGKAGEVELQYFFEASKLLLYCINMWKFEAPTLYTKRLLNNTQTSSSAILNKNKSSAKITAQENSIENGANSDSTSVPEATIQQQKLINLYKLYYTRWICYNYVPSFCESLDKYDTIMIYGLSFLKLVFGLIKHELQDKFISEKDKIPADKRNIFCNYLPK